MFDEQTTEAIEAAAQEVATLLETLQGTGLDPAALGTAVGIGLASWATHQTQQEGQPAQHNAGALALMTLAAICQGSGLGLYEPPSSGEDDEQEETTDA